jgi:hypothetical protein
MSAAGLAMGQQRVKRAPECKERGHEESQGLRKPALCRNTFGIHEEALEVLAGGDHQAFHAHLFDAPQVKPVSRQQLSESE